ncbi:MAG TPA: MalY/PatB family protein [Thermomicrobiales bacterium]
MTTTATFEMSLEALRARRGNKWNRYPKDVMPAWVADMDFSIAEPIQRAIEKLIVEEHDYGYGYRAGENSLPAAFVHRMKDRHGWDVDPELVLNVTGTVQGMFVSVMGLSEPGDGVLIQTPIYPPFLMTIEKSGRRMIENPLTDTGSGFALDIEGMRQAADEGTKIILFCNPHNPTGHVYTREELQAVGDLAVERDLIIVSDEVHADLIYSGHKHIPIATLSPEIAARTVTLTAASKGFNLAALRCSIIYFGSSELRERFRKVLPDYVLGSSSVVGIDATVAAWYHGQPWLDEVLKKLESNRDYVAQFISDQLPGIKHYKPEGTYLSWLNCENLHLPGESPYEFFLNEAKVGFNNGGDFGPLGKHCVRLNFATSREVLDEVLGRMADAIERTPALSR